MWFWVSLASIALNIFLFLYIRWLLKTIEAVNDDMIVLTDMLAEYSKHIESVYELEMFYGDETLKSLMSHSKGFLETRAPYRKREGGIKASRFLYACFKAFHTFKRFLLLKDITIPLLA